MGNILRAFDSDKPNIKRLSLVKDPALQGRIDTMGGDYDALRNTGRGALSDYLTTFLAGTPTAKAWAGEETGAIDPFFNGRYRSEHDTSRAAATAARNAAAERWGLQALANLKRGSVVNEGGPSSFDRRALVGTLAGLGDQIALNEANMLRSDREAEFAAPLALIGRRGAIQDSLAARELEPWAAENRMFGSNAMNLAALANLTHGNKDYGMYKKRSGLEKAADIIDAFEGRLLQDMSIGGQAASTAGSVAGAAGGGASL